MSSAFSTKSCQPHALSTAKDEGRDTASFKEFCVSVEGHGAHSLPKMPSGQVDVLPALSDVVIPIQAGVCGRLGPCSWMHVHGDLDLLVKARHELVDLEAAESLHSSITAPVPAQRPPA